MIDSHCHLDHEPLLSDLANVIQRSKEVGIEKLLTISTSFESFSRVKDLINKDDMIYGTIGIHPHEANKDIVNSEFIEKSLKDINKEKSLVLKDIFNQTFELSNLVIFKTSNIKPDKTKLTNILKQETKILL